MSRSDSNSIDGKIARGTLAGVGPSAFGFGPLCKRLFDIFFSGCGLVVLSPLFLAIAALVKIADGGAVFYRQVRVGLHGRPFRICKFRTMVPRADEAGPSVTRDGDTRVTWIGRFLRRTKLDELPQLWNVLKGEMSLVGPRPEVPKYVQQYTAEQRGILNYKPGITDLASICFRDEELLLRNADRVEEFYLQHCVPRKMKLNLEYAGRANPVSDLWIILQTICPYWVCALSLYAVILAASFGLSCLLAYDFALPPQLRQGLLKQMCVVVAVQTGALIWRQQYKGLLSYFSLPELREVAAALSVACLLLLGLWGLSHRSRPPLNLMLVNLLLSLFIVSGCRLVLRLWRETCSAENDAVVRQPVRVGIIGAGCVGSKLAREVMADKALGRTIVAFFDDDSQKWQKRIHEIPVVGLPECLLNGWAKKVDEVVIAMPKANPDRIQQIHQLVQGAGLAAYTAPFPRNQWHRQQNQSPAENRS